MQASNVFLNDINIIQQLFRRYNLNVDVTRISKLCEMEFLKLN